MNAENEFDVWWESHRQKQEPECGDVKSAFLSAFALGRKSGLEEGDDVYRCVKCGAIYLDSPVSVCDCAHDATEFRLCKLIDPIRQRIEETI